MKVINYILGFIGVAILFLLVNIVSGFVYVATLGNSETAYNVIEELFDSF